ncbi:phage terminase large subunit [uncultured Maritimibacter sp.]|uniref:phage terminase large subunit n=1 Tax=uncultured Maritimibacter sp. TaxID=991866 RepID=UPI00259802F0|nr:phage terminase large subunit [uncultured Maritimibacter sp.]
MTGDLLSLSKHYLALLEYELACREAEDSLIAFAQFTMPQPRHMDDPTVSRYMPGAHHLLMADLMEQIERGEEQKVIINTMPRAGKSELCTKRFAAWFAGRHPDLDIMVATYNEKFAQDFAKDVRDIFNSPRFKQAFPEFGTTIASTEHIRTHAGGNLYFLGRRSSTTGRGANLILVDDPTKDDKEVRYSTFREDVWQWFSQTLLTRRHNDKAAIVISQCLTGDTQVTMADGSWRRMDELRVGDFVKAYEDGNLVDREVLAHVPQGEDDVFEIRTGNHRVRANARHPFLIERANGEREWVRVRDMKKGDRIVAAGRIDSETPAILNEREAWLLGYMFGDGWVTVRDRVQKGRGQYTTKDGEKRVYAEKTYPRRGFVTCVALTHREEENERVAQAFDEVFGIVPKITKYGYRRTDVARVGRWFAKHGLIGNAHTKRIPAWVFSEPRAVREAFIRGYLEADGAVFATGRQKGGWTFGSCNEDLIKDVRHLLRGLGYDPTNIAVYRSTIQAPNSPEPTESINAAVRCRPWSQTDDEFSAYTIRSIKPAGREEVYDIQVRGAECFLADGLVSHNTRWHEDDVVGRITDPSNPAYSKKFHEGFKVVNLPSIAENDDPLGRKPGEALWPERFGLGYLEEMREANPVSFAALYQCDPTPDDGVFYMADGIFEYDVSELPKNLRMYCVSDHAVSTQNHNDPSVLLPFGICEDGIAWIMPQIVWRRMDANETVEEMLTLIESTKPIFWYAEKGHISKAIGPFLRKRMDETGIYCPIIEEQPVADKEQRAISARGRAAQGKIRFPKYAPWWPRAKAELLKFPNGRFDDFVDCISMIGLKLVTHTGPGKATEVREKDKPGTYGHLLKQFREEDEARKAAARRAGW